MVFSRLCLIDGIVYGCIYVGVVVGIKAPAAGAPEPGLSVQIVLCQQLGYLIQSLFYFGNIVDLPIFQLFEQLISLGIIQCQAWGTTPDRSSTVMADFRKYDFTLTDRQMFR